MEHKAHVRHDVCPKLLKVRREVSIVSVSALYIEYGSQIMYDTKTGWCSDNNYSQVLVLEQIVPGKHHFLQEYVIHMFCAL